MRCSPFRGLRSSASGFTLLEIMLAVGILGFVIVIVYGVFARTLSGKEYTEARAAEMATARAVLNRMERDLAALVPRAASQAPQPSPTPSRVGLPEAVEQFVFLSRNQTEGGTPFDDLAFTALLRRPLGITLSTADLVVIRYFIESDPANPARKALFREAVYSLSGEIFDVDKPSPSATTRLLDGVGALEFQFFDGREWVQEWDSTDVRNFGPAPQAVQIAFALWNERGEPEVFRTAVDLPIVRSAPLPMPGTEGTPAPSPTARSSE